MLTAKQLLRFSRIHRPSLISNARRTAVRFEECEDLKGADGTPYRHNVIKVRGSTIDRKVIFDIYEPWKGEDSPIWVSCDCEYWLYHCEQAVERKSSTDIIYCDPSKRVSDPERQKNPNMIAHCCKHLISSIMKGVLVRKPKSSKYFDLRTGKPLKK